MGQLADRRNAAHMTELEAAGLGAIDLVVSNLYPFQSAVASGKVFDECIEIIGIDWLTMIHAAVVGKTGGRMAVVPNPGQLLRRSVGRATGDERQQKRGTVP